MVEAALYFLAMLLLIGCDGEWGGGQVGRVSCTFDEFFPNVKKMAVGSNGNELFILDDYSNVYSYKRDNLYECAFDLDTSYMFSGFPSDVLFANNNFYVQDGIALKSKEDKELCKAKNGVFSVNGGDLAVGDKFGIEIWDISSCTRKNSITSQSVLAISANDEYYVAEPQNLVMYSKNGQRIYSEPLSSTPGNEKNFCSADRIAANDYGVYLLDKKCKKIGVFDNQAVWRKTINLNSTPLDIGAGEYSYIFIMYSNGVEKVNVF